MTKHTFNEILYDIHNGRPIDMLNNLINFIGEDVAQEFYEQQWIDYDMDAKDIYLTVTKNDNGAYTVFGYDYSQRPFHHYSLNEAILSFLEYFEIDAYLDIFVNGKEYDIYTDD